MRVQVVRVAYCCLYRACNYCSNQR